MLETSARLLRLLSLLQSRSTWTGAELVDRLEVTDRTLRRDVDRLRDLGYPVHSTSGPAGGYMLGAGAVLPPLMLDDDEGIAVALGLQTSAHEASQRALAKLENVMPQRLRRRLAALRASIVQVPDRSAPAVALGSVADLATACAEHHAVRFRYRDHGGDSSERHAEPHRLALVGRRWYLVAWDRDRADWRTFRVDRVEAVVAGDRFVPRTAPDEDVAGYVSRSVTGMFQHRASVLFDAPADELRAKVPPQYGAIEPVGRRSRLTTSGSSLDGIAVWLAILGLPFEVESPPELRDHLGVLAARLTSGGSPARTSRDARGAGDPRSAGRSRGRRAGSRASRT